MNCVIAGMLIGYGIFMATQTDAIKLGIVLALVGVSHSALSLWGYKKFVGKGLFFTKD